MCRELIPADLYYIIQLELTNLVTTGMFHRIQCFRGICWFHLQASTLKMEAAGSSKYCYLSTKLHCIILQKTIILILRSSSHIIIFILLEIFCCLGNSNYDLLSLHAVIPGSNCTASWCRTPTGHLAYPLPPNVHFRYWRLVSVLFSTGPNHLSHGVSHCAKGCVSLGWILVNEVNDFLGAPGSTQLYLCLPPIWSTAGGDLLNPHYLWDHYGDGGGTSPQDLKMQRDSPSRKSLWEIL
jgi:hypothetical protein